MSLKRAGNAKQVTMGGTKTMLDVSKYLLQKALLYLLCARTTSYLLAAYSAESHFGACYEAGSAFRRRMTRMVCSCT